MLKLVAHTVYNCAVQVITSIHR